MNHITASVLFDYLQCPHRVWRDLYGPQGEKNPDGTSMPIDIKSGRGLEGDDGDQGSPGWQLFEE